MHVDDPGSVGDRWADVYDELTRAWMGDRIAARTVDALAQLAPGRRILELGIGTGRIALPLAERGFDVHGVDASEAMVAKLRDKPGGDAIPVSIGDFADVDADGSFGLVAVVFNTFFGLASQDDQVRCVGNVAKRLTERGVFVVEAFVPDVARFVDGQALRTSRVGSDDVWLVASTHDSVAQVIDATQIVMTEHGTRLLPVRHRYVWPSELDLMARLAGLQLHHRWAGWDRAPFAASSTTHVSVYSRHPA